MFSINYQVTKSRLIQFLMHISIFSGFCGILRNFAVFYGRVCGEAPKHSGIPEGTMLPVAAVLSQNMAPSICNQMY